MRQPFPVDVGARALNISVEVGKGNMSLFVSEES
jgi:hypothetical protein